MNDPSLTEVQQRYCESLGALLGGESHDDVRQGCELLLAVGDPAVLEHIARGCRFGDDGRLIAGPRLDALVRPLWRALVACELALARVACGLEAPPGRVDLRYAGVGDEGAEALARCEGLRGVASLDLRFARLGDRGVRAIAEAAHFGSITSLSLQRNGIGSAGARALAGSPHFRNLTSLDLRYNPIGVAGARAIAGAEHWSRLERLYVHLDDLGGASGAWELAESKHLPPVVRRFWEGRASQVDPLPCAYRDAPFQKNA
jgi:hypothetical protein